jgi:cytochrome bd-type quinol oxidase subunit 2
MPKCLGALLTAVLVLLAFLTAFAQHGTDDDAAACAACGGLVVVFAVIFIVNIAILVWVARDAKARGMSSPVGWLILIFFTGVLGLIIFILSRPKGPLAPCPHCGNKRLQAMVKCPHCGN